MALRARATLLPLSILLASVLLSGGASAIAGDLPQRGSNEVGQFAPAAYALDAESAVVTFSGLRVYEDGSSTLRVNLTEQTPVDFSQTGTKLRFVFAGAKVALRNNTHPLRAEHFSSNVMRTKLANSPEGAVLEVRLRKKVAPNHRMIVHAGGAILRVDIPPQG